jgi:DNA-binding response OmpR family regulator
MPALPLLRRPVGRVLVVDRDARSSAALRLIVEFDGHDVRSTADRVGAMTLLDEFRPHVILLDQAVAETGDPSLCEEVATRPDTPRPSIILTSTATDQRLDRRVLRWIAAHVTRPFDFVELRRLVSREIDRMAAGALGVNATI